MDIRKKLEQIKREDLIWIIYFFIVIGALLSNSYEKNYVLTGDLSKQKLFKTLNITLFCVAFFIYLYFVLQNYQEIRELRSNASNKEVIIKHVALIAALLFLIGGAFQIVVEINRDTPDVDIGIV